MKNNFKGKIALIVGGSRGIGFAIAKHLYDKHLQIIIASKNRQNSKKAALSLNTGLKNADYFKLDVTNQKQVKKSIEEIIKKYGRIDILVCSAGIFEPIGFFTTVPFQEHSKTIKTNLTGIMQCCYEVIPQMIKQRSGKIILLSGSGVGGDVPLENATSYFVSKGGLALFAEVLSAELKTFNIQINAILPGRILTDLTRATLNYSKEKLGKVLLKSVKDLKKTGGQSIEPLLKLIDFLISSKVSGKLLSAKWDKIDVLSKQVPSWKYTLKRIEGSVYKRNSK